MSINNNELLLKKWSSEKNPGILQLLNKDKIPVAAIYLDKINVETISILNATNINEKYYLYINGIAIFFTYFRRSYPEHS